MSVTWLVYEFLIATSTKPGFATTDADLDSADAVAVSDRSGQESAAVPLRSSVNRISAVSVRGQPRFMLFKGKVNGAVFVEFLKRLMHNAAHPIFLILDGASYHHGRLVKD